MKKKIIIIVLIINWFNIHSQINSGVITYKALLSNDFSGDGYKDAARESSKKLEFKLKFKNSSSLFYQVNNLDNENMSVSLAGSFLGYKNPVYYNKGIYKYYNNSSPIFDNKEFLINFKDTVGWTLSNETKIINDFICYKAETKRVVYKLEKEQYNTVIAWYCPKIAIPFGPLDCGELPGLIFELQNQYGSIILNKIEFDEKIDIKLPENGKDISEIDFNKLFILRMKEATESLKTKQ